ncbi:uncharacterized protein LOC100367854 [Saccoglossus kowalevskii]|uniref:Uncharacterized protein LOC100367854 n=1 Tax=Saccoglossus kowalevskii TaxID=10224 RepID=A0ABM0H0X4_SACKO|nr:PREDICTED: uncharacterized protein LOC100367854 [Saccoglossus kowalevskii]
MALSTNSVLRKKQRLCNSNLLPMPTATSSPVLRQAPVSRRHSNANASATSSTASTMRSASTSRSFGFDTNTSIIAASNSSGMVTISEDSFNILIENQRQLMAYQNELKDSMQDMRVALSEQQKKRKVKPSKAVQAEVRNVYKELEKNEFSWTLGSCGFRAAENAEVNRRVLLGVNNVMPGVKDDVITMAMKTYFMSKKKKEKKEVNGTYDEHKKKQSRKQRLYSKLNKRVIELNRNRSIPEGDKELYASAMKVGYMSSEVSGSEDDAEDQRKLLVVNPLPWRSVILNNLFKSLDEKHAKRVQNKGVILERCRRKVGAQSTRDYPSNAPRFSLIDFSSGEEEGDNNSQGEGEVAAAE